MTNFRPTHPGDVLREDFLEPLNLSQWALAEAIGVPPMRVSDLIARRCAIGADTALRLARYFGTSPEFWMGMQATYDLEVARERVGSEIETAIQPRGL